MILNQVQLEPSIWPYAIHSNNSEIIHLLEEKNISFESKINCYEEAIKCHHNDVANYIMNNYISRSLDNSSFLLKCFNFNFITDKNINENLFFELCKYDYYTFVKYFVENGNIDYNQVHVHWILFFFIQLKILDFNEIFFLSNNFNEINITYLNKIEYFFII